MTEQDEAVRLLRIWFATFTNPEHEAGLNRLLNDALGSGATAGATSGQATPRQARESAPDTLATPPPVPAAEQDEAVRPKRHKWRDIKLFVVEAVETMDGWCIPVEESGRWFVSRSRAALATPPPVPAAPGLDATYAPILKALTYPCREPIHRQAAEALARLSPVQDYERLGRAIHAAKKIGGPWGAACGYTNEANVYVEVEYNGGPPGDYACECESMARHLIELQQ